LLTSNRRPSVTYLAFKVRYVNPARQRFYDALSQCADVTPFGPGYAEPAARDGGAERFFEQHGLFVLVVADEYILQDFSRNIADARFVNHACSFDPFEFRRATEWREYLRTCPVERLITLLQSDFYNLPGTHVEKLDELSDY